MNDTSFARLAQLGELLERTSKRKELTALLADFLCGLSPDEVPPAEADTLQTLRQLYDQQFQYKGRLD